MADYRLYFLRRAAIISAREFTCVSDDEAREVARAYDRGGEMELWQLGRRIEHWPERPRALSVQTESSVGMEMH